VKITPKLEPVDGLPIAPPPLRKKAWKKKVPKIWHPNQLPTEEGRKLF
jgi:hypothetical protein